MAIFRKTFFLLALFIVFAVAYEAAYGQAALLGKPPQIDEGGARIAKPFSESAQPQSALANWLDTSSRAAVQSSYLSVFAPTGSVPMGWSGNLQAGNSGTTSAAYKQAVVTRINWMRELAGVPDIAGLNPTYNQADQDAAMMISVNQELNHDPPATLTDYTAAGALASANSNLCGGFPANDPGCIAMYMYDSGSNNTEVAHRRWILYPETVNMGTGDVPQQTTLPSANALWVLDSASFGNPRPTVRDGFVAWPSKGFFPYELLPVRWSFSYPGADFTNATITVAQNGNALPVAIEPLAKGYGENAIVWTINNQDPAANITPTAPVSDTIFSVVISNVVIDGTPRNFTYEVTLFDPNKTPPVAPSIVEVATAEGENPVIAPNTWIYIKGANLAPAGDARTWTGSDFANGQMPQALDGVSVTINGGKAFVYYISGNQINVLTPPDLAPGWAQVQVTANGVTSPPATVQVQSAAPSFFVFNGGPQVIAAHLNGSLIGPADLFPGQTTPAAPGETIVIFGNGFGATTSPVANGANSQSGSLASLPVITIGGVQANVSFAGLISPGLYQFNVEVPATVASGNNPIVAAYQGLSTQAGVTLSVQP